MDKTPGILDPSQYKLIETMCARKQGAILHCSGSFAYLVALCAQQHHPFSILTGTTFHIKKVQFELSLLFLMIEHLGDE